MLKLNRFKNSIANLSNVENVRIVNEAITFNTNIVVDERLLLVKGCISFTYDYGYTISSSILNGSNTNDRKLAKEYVTFLIEKAFV